MCINIRSRVAVSVCEYWTRAFVCYSERNEERVVPTTQTVLSGYINYFIINVFIVKNRVRFVCGVCVVLDRRVGKQREQSDRGEKCIRSRPARKIACNSDKLFGCRCNSRRKRF